MARIRRRLAQETAFTLVELLVVMLIIGILSAVGIAAFLGQRSKAQDGEAKVYVAAAAKALEIWHTEHGTYAGADPAALTDIEPALGRARHLVVSGDDSTFAVTVDSAAGTNGGGSYSIRRLADGDTRRDCTNAGVGGCLAAPDPRGNRW
jgi:prepilin-type N-terminal cleavage/methylation domain-containing protein